MTREQRRKLAAAGFVKREAAIRSFADQVLRGAKQPCPNVVIGPVVWGIDPGSDARHWYFVVGSTGADPAVPFRVDQLKIAQDDKAQAEWCRAALMVELIQRKPIVIHEFDDELEMARWSEAMCPCEKTRTILASLERERADP
jgi:hypothetical protein